MFYFVKTKNLISKPLVKYKNILSDLSAHNKSIHHLSSLQDAENLKLIFENKKDKINLELDKNLKKSLKVTRSGFFFKTLIFLAKQNLAIRGHSDDRILTLEDLNSNREWNFGNLLSFTFPNRSRCQVFERAFINFE